MTTQLFKGDALDILRTLPTASVDAIITDPPYSSGGLMRSDKMKSTAEKYMVAGGGQDRPDFSGDNRDQRSWVYWCALWIGECRRVLKPGGYFMAFTDWRQLPASTDAVQAGGIVWRGLISWDKGRGSRAPHKGYFRHQCEYVVWGTNGPLRVPGTDENHPGPFDGSFSMPVKQSDKFHQTGKPTELMRELVKVVPPGSVILDPFMGSGTTGVAAIQEGRHFIGIEMGDEYYGVSKERIEKAA